MSRLFPGAFVLLTALPAAADPSRDVCAQWGDFATQVMSARQNGLPKARILTALSGKPADFRSHYLTLVDRAWRMGRVPGGEAQADVIGWFSDSAVESCRDG